MSITQRGCATTTSGEGGPPGGDIESDATPGLALIYSRMHAHLPSAFPLEAPVGSLGRENDNAIVIPENAISRHHARFERRADGRTWVVDTESTNGTFVNGQKICAPTALAEHDVLRVGDTLFRFVERGIHAYRAYRIDGKVVERRFFKQSDEQRRLVGGYQMDAILAQIAKLAPNAQINFELQGETGTGKELVAEEIHRLSGRAGRLVALNCAALPESLIESELFGYRRGAFSGASSDSPGQVRAADRGTLFLDEVGDMPLVVQAKVLRLLQEKKVQALGAVHAEPVDVRFVCATHHDLDALVAQGKFRRDLRARLCGAIVHLPCLRQRREDLFALVLRFLEEQGRADTEVGFSFMAALAHHDWPANVRELQSAVRLAVTLGDGALRVRHLPEAVRRGQEGERAAPAHPSGLDSERGAGGPSAAGESTLRSRDTPTREQLVELFERHEGNVAAIARELGKERMQIHRWLKRYGLNPEDYRRRRR